MTTSNTDSWNPQLLFIIRQALINVTAIDENEQPSAQAYQDGLYALNGLTKTLEATGLHVWTEEEAILFLEPYQKRYQIGGTGTPLPDNTSDADSWVQLTLASPAVAGANQITLQTGQGALLGAGNYIGVIDNDGVTEWFTVLFQPPGDVVTLSGTLIVGADAGNYALAYYKKISRPLKVPKARLLTLNGLNETPMTVLSRQEYMDLPNKAAMGTPTQWFYTPQRDLGWLYIWPVPQFSNWAVRFTWYRPLQDWLTPQNTADFPQEWVLPLTWNLAKELAPGFGVPDRTWMRIKEMADNYALLATSYDRESEPIQFGYDYATGGSE